MNLGKKQCKFKIKLEVIYIKVNFNMKFYRYIFKFSLHKNTQIFSKIIKLRTFQNMTIHQKPAEDDFREYNPFLLWTQKKSFKKFIFCIFFLSWIQTKKKNSLSSFREFHSDLSWGRDLCSLFFFVLMRTGNPISNSG